MRTLPPGAGEIKHKGKPCLMGLDPYVLKSDGSKAAAKVFRGLALRQSPVRFDLQSDKLARISGGLK
jgi:hypothetical protein